MTSYRYAPDGYDCPFCAVADGRDRPVRTQQQDVVYRDEWATAFIASKWWPHNKGHVLVIPNVHYENLFELPQDTAGWIHHAAQLSARAMKSAYGCAGVSTRQHNGPAGGQDVWHYHLHVYPRYPNDNLYGTWGYQTLPDERLAYGKALRAWIGEHV